LINFSLLRACLETEECFFFFYTKGAKGKREEEEEQKEERSRGHSEQARIHSDLHDESSLEMSNATS
jgi:hypothetical protein